MALLNEPLGYEPAPDDEWTPARGMARGAWFGLGATLALAAISAPLAVHAPFLFIPWLLRGALALGVALLLRRVVQWAAGMAGPYCRYAALVFTFVWLLSHQVCFAIAGVPAGDELQETWLFPAGLLDEIVPRDGLRLIGWEWLSFGPVLVLNSVPLVVLLVVYMPLTRED
ncbi:MAG TPA: hypothetical protein PKC49_00825 [Phycisphaerae bacterium]|nr:hypothetical protein [Phycisphaerae bacterium]